MEENSNSVLVTTVKSTIDAHKDSIDTSHRKIIDKVKTLAADYAVRGVPEHHSPSIEPYIEEVRGDYSTVLNDSSLSLGGSVRNQLGALDIFSLRQKIKELKLKANAAKSALDALKASAKKFIGQMTLKEFEKLHLRLNIFTVIETLGYILAYLSIGDNWLLAIVWGLITSLLQTTGLKALVLWMRDGSGAALSRFTKYLVWGGVALVATGLGLLRYATIQAGGDNGFAQSALAPFVFILISYFLISVLALYVWHNYPKPEGQANMKKAEDLENEIKAKEIELKGLEEQISKLTEDCNTVAQVHTLLIQASKDFYHRINNHFLSAVGVFKSTNRISRVDNITPDCFSEPVSPLAIPSYDAWDDAELDTKPITDPI